MPGQLFVVGTPIGNLDDLTARAVRTLRDAPVIAAEDTRRTRGLLTHLGIAGKDLVAIHAHSSDGEVRKLVERLVRGDDVALVTDAGTPGVSDPGDALVAAALEAGVRVTPIPGPSAVVAALSASGLAGASGFRFAGFLPRSGVARAESIASICATETPVILYESPERTGETLADLAAATPDRQACVARELTKLHEEFVRGSLVEIAKPREWLGEITIVLGAFARPAEVVTDEALDAKIDEELAKGTHSKVAAQKIAAWSGRPQREIYARVVARKPR